MIGFQFRDQMKLAYPIYFIIFDPNQKKKVYEF